MLVEYLTGEGGTPEEQQMASQISRLIIAGNSISAITLNQKGDVVRHGEEPKPVRVSVCQQSWLLRISSNQRRFGNDAATFSPHPIMTLSAALLDVSQVMPIHILPGDTDPSGIILPQQPFPRAMFGLVSTSPTFVCETNPTYIRLAIGSDVEPSRPVVPRTLLVNSGQPLNDMFKYLASPPHTRLAILESTLKWRHMAPTAPDTLWCHPYFTSDPFIMTETPDFYIVGGQKQFATRLVQDQGEGGDAGGKPIRCRIVMVPDFASTGILVLLNMRTLEVKIVQFALENMTGGGDDVVEGELRFS